ncbi:uncharacterized protein BXZ73DRAFT_81925 [Epithele typhae]|uniref:uncharacterized protein n=1 Tax=Epithele typhae TaxID=378194 RepID=UPI002008D977|nr:uncharacterized protein BXZ73DRAFT_81925 [Epithele typhae]KAH9913463.1 hypothetical protein BXZ73DRAFT_81925 [Epithele typhae]
MSKIVFYTNPVSNNSLRARLALDTAKAEYTTQEINLMAMPDWYRTVNPLGQIPALSYGATTDPSTGAAPSGTIVYQSIAIIEFLAELYPDGGILPKDLSARTKARVFAHTIEARLVPAWMAAFRKGESPSALVTALAEVQAMLPPVSEGTFAVGEWSMAEMVAGPHLALAWLMLSHDVGKYEAGLGLAAWKELSEGEKFARLRKYVEDIKAHPVWQASWNELARCRSWGEH